MLVIAICATKSYAYAMRAQARMVAANVSGLPGGCVILSTDGSEALRDIHKYYEAVMPAHIWRIESVEDASLAEHENYKHQAQLVIARLRQNAFTVARKLQASRCWSLDSDTLPPANALRCMEHSLSFDDGYYSIATCPYPNESFLGGRGTPHNPIAEDFLPEERQLTPFLEQLLEALKAAQPASPVPDANPESDDEQSKRRSPERLGQIAARIHKWVKHRPPKGNVFALNAKSWRRRGWLEFAYPAIGKGSIVPSDWCGFGCTLMTAEALAHAHFEGYDGGGTEDLYIVWQRWHQAGLRINVIPHCPCDHVIHAKKKGGAEGEYTHIRSYHETEGECIGHLRTRKVPWLYD